jgi:hypothetical protein
MLGSQSAQLSLKKNMTSAYVQRTLYNVQFVQVSVRTPYLTVSQPYFSMSSEGSTPLCLDLDIFSHSTTEVKYLKIY